MTDLYRKTLSLLTPKEKRRGGLVLGMVVIMAALETAGVASVMPFLAVLGDPEMVQSNPVLASVYDTLGFQSVDAFLFALGAAAFGLILFSALFRLCSWMSVSRTPWSNTGSTAGSRSLLVLEPEAQVAKPLPDSVIASGTDARQSRALSRACPSVCHA